MFSLLGFTKTTTTLYGRVELRHVTAVKGGDPCGCVCAFYTSINNTLAALQYHERDLIVITIIETCLLSAHLPPHPPNFSPYSRSAGQPKTQAHTHSMYPRYGICYVVYSRSRYPPHSTQRYDVMAYYIPTHAVTVIKWVERERCARPKNSRVHKSCSRYAPALAIMNKRTILETARARRVHKSRIGPSRRRGGLADVSPPRSSPGAKARLIERWPKIEPSNIQYDCHAGNIMYIVSSLAILSLTRYQTVPLYQSFYKMQFVAGYANICRVYAHSRRDNYCHDVIFYCPRAADLCRDELWSAGAPSRFDDDNNTNITHASDSEITAPRRRGASRPPSFVWNIFYNYPKQQLLLIIIITLSHTHNLFMFSVVSRSPL